MIAWIDATRPRAARLLACALIVLVSIVTSGCDEGGIGIGVPASGARWGSGAAGPDVFVAGGPVYR
jgi:hypothetical protein